MPDCMNSRACFAARGVGSGGGGRIDPFRKFVETSDERFIWDTSGIDCLAGVSVTTMGGLFVMVTLPKLTRKALLRFLTIRTLLSSLYHFIEEADISQYRAFCCWVHFVLSLTCLLYTSPSPRDA